MRFVRRALAVIGILLLVIVVVSAGAGLYLVRRPWPQIKGNLAVAGLTAQVQMIRDKWGVPQIYAQNEHDLLFAQGYVHAQDRLWQLEFNRRIGSGTLSAILGDATLDIDRFMRTVGLRRAAEKDLALADAETLGFLQAYADGVNAYVDSHRSRLPLEFTILGVNPAPWTPVDSLTWGKVMAYTLCANYDMELLRARLIADLGADAAQQLLPAYPANAPTIVPAGAQGFAWLRGADVHAPEAVTALLGSAGMGAGSNNWVVSGSRTATGKPMVADDTHLSLNMPSIWYEVGLHGGGLDVVGFSFPGVPMVVIGHNARIAWGVTNLPADVEDLYIEKLKDASNPTQYEFAGQWENLQIVPEVIEVKGAQPVTVNVLITRHGPIVNDVVGAPKDAQPMALRWTALDGSQLFRALEGIDMAANWDAFRQALQYWDVPSQNFVYADVDGHIGYQTPGKIPIRAPGHDGTVPVPGWTGQYEWQGYIPFDQLPSLFDPPQGYIATANNKVVGDQYPYHLASEWSAPYRAQRITDLLAANSSMTVQGMHDIQAQTYSLPGEALRPYMLGIQPQAGAETQAWDALKTWDLSMEVDRVGAAIHQVWSYFLVRDTFGDKLGADLLETYMGHSEMYTPLIISLMAQPDSPWFDDKTTPQVETRDDILKRSLTDAVTWLSQNAGKDPSKWTWGKIHTITFVHQPLGQSGIGLLENLFNAGPIPARGDEFTVDAGWVSLNPLFTMNGGASQRMIADLSDWSNSLSIQTTGQNGQLFNRHRTDFVQLWQNVEYHPMIFTQEAAQQNAEGELTLTPK